MTKRKVRTPINPEQEIEVDQTAASGLKELDVLASDVPVKVASTRIDGGPGAEVALRSAGPLQAGGPLGLGATHDIQTTMRPDLTITVSDAEYQQLLAEGLVYSGTPQAPAPDFYDLLFAGKVSGGTATPAALRAALVPFWTAAEAVTSTTVRMAPDGHVILSNSSRTTRGSYDATEQGNWTAVGGGSSGTAALTPTATKTATYTAAVGDLAMMNVAGGAAVLNLPAAPANKAQVGYRAIGATNAVPLTVNRGGSDTIGTTGATSATLPMADETVVLQYDAPNTRWLGVANVRTQASIDARYGGAYGLAIGSGTCVIPVGTTAEMFGNLTVTTETTVSYRGFFPLSDPTCTTVLPVFQNQPNLVQSGDFAPPNPITISAACELSDGTVVDFYFNGSRTITITAGQMAIPDYPVNFGAQVTDAATQFSGMSGVVIRTFVSVAASRTDTATVTSGSATVADAAILTSDQGRLVTGTGIPNNTFVGTVSAGTSFLLSTRPDSQVNVNANAAGTSVTVNSVIPHTNSTGAQGNVKLSSSDLTVEGSAAGKTGFGGSSSNGYGPSLLLAPPGKVRKPIVASLTDSIFFGTSDSNMGPIARACAQYGFGHVKLAKVGETAATYATPAAWKYRRSQLTGCTHAVIELGTNDGVDTVPKATTLQTNLTTLLTYLNSIGVKSIIATVPPKGISSTDGYATAANSTMQNIPTALAQINTWIRGLVGTNGVVGVVDLNTVLSTATDSSFWAQAPVARHLTDLATTSGSNIVTSASANFTSADIGYGIFVTGVYTSFIARIQSINSTTSVNVFNYSNAANPVAFNAASTVSAAVGGVGSFYATQDGIHPSNAMMIGSVLTAVQTAMSGLSI